MYLPFAGTYSNLYAMVLAGVCIGVIGGFFGVSGSFLLTPLLNALGFPVTFAVGTNLAHFFGRSVLTAVKNNALSRANWKLGAIIGLAGASGVHLGKVFLLTLEEIGAAGAAAGALFTALLSGTGIFLVLHHILGRKAENTVNLYASISTFSERLRRIHIFPMVYFPEYGGKSISLWLLAAIGVGTGLLSGVLGISGSFIRLPALVFIAGIPVLPALCTDVLATMISLGFGAAGFAFSGRAEIVAAMLLLLGSGVGSHIGHMATRHVERTKVNLILLINVSAAFAGLALKQLGYPAPAAVLMLGPVFITSSILVLAMAGDAIRESRPAVGLPAAKELPGEATNHSVP